MPFCRQPEIGSDFKKQVRQDENQETVDPASILTVTFDVGGTLERYGSGEPFAELVDMALEMAARPERYRVLIVTDNIATHKGPKIVGQYCQEKRRNNTIADGSYLNKGDLHDIDVDVSFDDSEVSYLKGGQPRTLSIKVDTLDLPGKELSFAGPGSQNYHKTDINTLRGALGLPNEKDLQPLATVGIQPK